MGGRGLGVLRWLLLSPGVRASGRAERVRGGLDLLPSRLLSSLSCRFPCPGTTPFVVGCLPRENAQNLAQARDLRLSAEETREWQRQATIRNEGGAGRRKRASLPPVLFELEQPDGRRTAPQLVGAQRDQPQAEREAARQ